LLAIKSHTDLLKIKIFGYIMILLFAVS
jgi:hypothetical protein